jgi:phosphate-selective porin OprO and OprP
MRTLFLSVLLTCVGFSALAQTEVDERAVIRFDEGLGFHAPDTTFGLNLRFRIQNRMGLMNYQGGGNAVDEVEARMRRLRLRIDGYTKDQRLTYYLQLSFSRDDQDWDNSRVPNVVRDAMVYYNFSEKFYFGFGQGKLPGNRQRIISSGQLQFTDRSLVNATFNIDRDFGLMFYFSDALADVDFNLKGAITGGEGRNILKTDNGIAYTGRVEIMPFGRFTNDGDFSEGDLERETTPKLSLAAGYSFNYKAIRNAGQRGLYLAEHRNIGTLHGDLMFEYMSWAWYAEVIERQVNDPFILSVDQNPLHILSGTGFNTQLSYYFINAWEIAGRYSWLKPSEKLSANEPMHRE